MSNTRRAGLLSALLLLASAAHGHAVIVSSQPASGAAVAGAALPVQLRFNSRIDRQRSRLVLVGPDGTKSVLAIAPTEAPDVIAARAGELRQGSYRLRWQVMSVDGHITRGDIPFEVVH
jgi:copper resistance protein C